MIGQTLGRYSIREQIGAGGMGVVYRAHDERLNRDVALKVLRSGLLADESTRKRFREEALNLSRLNHPNIETVYDFDSQNGVDFLVMEFVAGSSLAEEIAAGPVVEDKVIRIGIQIAEGLSAAHQDGIVHCDLKPDNVRLMPDRRVKILDFGLSQFLRSSRPSPANERETVSELQVGGTLPYMAPEQVRGQWPDARVDVYALGAVLYEMSTGRRPFPEKDAPELMISILQRAPVSTSPAEYADVGGAGTRHSEVPGERSGAALSIRQRGGLSTCSASARTGRRITALWKFSVRGGVGCSVCWPQSS